MKSHKSKLAKNMIKAKIKLPSGGKIVMYNGQAYISTIIPKPENSANTNLTDEKK